MARCSPPPSFSSPHRQQKRQPATNTVRRRRISASDISRGAIRKGDLLRQICAVEALGESFALGRDIGETIPQFEQNRSSQGT
ncbi:hypothetical protein ILYODFUR_011531 [Ilyodon furcidens]|uniref:Uncharacterized protein n=1 Tax=Ilyodon furcidens TaxID=33524 RepID=A0ABV0TJL0_9TELE